ncbi:hypothetical protein SCLCIDRAFT_1216295 [Scleroderma citrinum Foug A]|uniref:Uncharacterized protein n=1 Tax=Scleroderma citrinum Foug A TaxID=1036808 RepID=A0A0C3A813_9AGAM|nr:hypothetical protein SCLCIDRAFT_1216295 [Scleroderma citrinum Foug A]
MVIYVMSSLSRSGDTWRRASPELHSESEIPLLGLSMGSSQASWDLWPEQDSTS